MEEDSDYFYQHKTKFCRASRRRAAGYMFLITSLMSITCYIGYLVGIKQDEEHGSH